MTLTPTDRSVLVVEDEYFMARELAEALGANGIAVIGPVGSVDDALDLLDDSDQIDGAVVDINLQGEKAFPIADALLARGIPFVFVTGYDRSAIPARYDAVPRCEKPANVSDISRALFGRSITDGG